MQIRERIKARNIAGGAVLKKERLYISSVLCLFLENLAIYADFRINLCHLFRAGQKSPIQNLSLLPQQEVTARLRFGFCLLAPETDTKSELNFHTFISCLRPRRTDCEKFL